MMYEPVIGLEVHIQLNTKSKLFSTAPVSFGAEPNSQACLVDLAYPGTLPVLNKEAVHQAILLGLAINAQITPKTVFSRKNYFYPDLPKGYQTSQGDLPIVANGSLTFKTPNSLKKTVNILRAHLEEDAGKSIHDLIPGCSAIDLNRAGSALLEIVTSPEFFSADEVIGYLKTLHRLVRHLKICDGNMQEGSFRVDVNISLRPVGTFTLGTRCEIKNINSFRFIEKAIAYEMERQAKLLNQGQKVRQQTRLFQESTGQTVAMRDKEDRHDYRYFPCPDLAPLHIKEELIAKIKGQLPVSLESIETKLLEHYLLTEKETAFLMDNFAVYNYFESVLTQNKEISPKVVCNLLLSELIGICNKAEKSFEDISITPMDFAIVTLRSMDGTLSSKTTKQILNFLVQGHTDVDNLIVTHQLKQISDPSILLNAIDQVITQYPSQYAEFKSGKDKILAFLVGQVMKQTKGSGDPEEIQRLFLAK